MLSGTLEVEFSENGPNLMSLAAVLCLLIPMGICCHVIVETSEPPIPSVSDVDAVPVTSWTEVVSKKRKKMFPSTGLK